MKFWIILSAIIPLLGLSGCVAPQQPVYYYGSYSRTLYQAKKNPSPEKAAKHQAELLSIIEQSKQRNLRVPPGICCEYGWALAQTGRVSEAETYFAMEQRAYPESAAFVGFLRSQITKGNRNL